MNSEKVKEIKQALEFNANEDFCFLPYIDDKDKQNTVEFADILTLINELESENERLKTSEFNSYQELDNASSQIHSLENRIAELEGEMIKLDIINGKLEMDIELLNKQNTDLEIDRDYYQEQFNEQEDFYIKWNKQQLEEFAERLKEKDLSIPIHKDFIIIENKAIEETLKECLNETNE